MYLHIMVPNLLFYTILFPFLIPTRWRITHWCTESLSVTKSGSTGFFARTMGQDSGTVGVDLFQITPDRMVQCSGFFVSITFFQSSGIRSKVTEDSPGGLWGVSTLSPRRGYQVPETRLKECLYTGAPPRNGSNVTSVLTKNTTTSQASRVSKD